MNIKNREKIESLIIDRLFPKLEKLNYGEISIVIRVHDRKVVDITHTLLERTKDWEVKNEIIYGHQE
ncbi:hypothetical protein LQZ19_11435 [Treponema primitia]|uniref:hypothetical protein n=1 Tax=Treponema primitia TaxID=88058 RepID=UPI00398192D9